MGYSYINNELFGAILVTSPEVTIQCMRLFLAQARKFVKQNAAALWYQAQDKIPSEDFRRFGLCIIKDTWNVDKYMLTGWRGKGNGASIGFGARAAGLASALTSAEWFQGSSAGQWHSNDPSLDQHKRVVFASGVKFHSPRWWESSSKPEPLRSHGTESESGREFYDIEDEVVELQWETFGDFTIQDSAEIDPEETVSDEEETI